MTETEKKNEQTIPVKTRKKKKKIYTKILYGIVLFVIFVVCSLYAVYQYTNSVSATVMIDYMYSSDGKNPDGTPFNIMEIFNDDIMNNASEKLGGKLSAQEIRSHITISDTLTDSSFAKLEQSILDGEDENIYFPTEYLITYSTISDQIENEGISAQWRSFCDSFSLPSKEEILDAVLSSYQEYYDETYLNYDDLFDIDWTAIDSMDYYNRYEFMNDTVQRFIFFLEHKSSRSMSEKVTDTDAGYKDLLLEFSKGPAKNIEKYQDYITENGITNDKEVLLNQFVYMQKINEEENLRKVQEYNVLKEAIEMYDSTTTKVVFIPALDGNDEFYMNRTNIGLDYLTEKADSAKLSADTAAYAAERYSYLQTCFGEEDMPDEQGNTIKVKNTSEHRAHADNLYNKLKDEIKRLANEASILASEGKEVYQEDINVSETFISASIISVGISFAKRFVIAVMATYVVIYAITNLSERKKIYRG